MSLSADRGSCPVLSKREREQNRSLHLLPRTVRTALEQVEQVVFLPEKTCSWTREQVTQKGGVFPAVRSATCSNGLRTGQTPPRKPDQRMTAPINGVFDVENASTPVYYGFYGVR